VSTIRDHGDHEVKHELFKNGDPDRPRSICDDNGEVVLGLCRKCGAGEIELEQPCDDLTAIKRLRGKRFRHFKGGLYIFEGPVYDATADRWMVGYKKEHASILYTRTYDDFMGMAEVKRFTELL
jgi:hypothetical protein